jgi:hypothetical protein
LRLKLAIESRKTKMAVFWVVAPCFQGLLLEPFSWTLIEQTRRYNPVVSHLRTHHRENLKSYLAVKQFSTFVKIQL